MSLPKRSKKDRRGYEEALLRIEVCRREGANGTDLDLSRLGLTQLPSAVGSLSALTCLDLDDNEFTTLPPEIECLTSLIELSLNDNKLTSLSSGLAQLSSLERLYLSGNDLRDLPEEIWQIPALKELILYDNKIANLPREIGQLTALRELYLSNNRLRDLPHEIGQLENLRELYLSDNRLDSLPLGIGKLSKLTELDLSGNRFTSLPVSIGELTRLRSLVLERNSLVELPETLHDLTRLKELALHENDSLGLPREVLGPPHNQLKEEKRPASPANILNYYFRTLRGRRPLNEAKLILVGRGGVGKTCLIKRLINDTFNLHEPETPGIEIQPWPVTLPEGDEVRLHVWDFGGQEILHATHQFFLTERTIYLLVLSGREGAPTQDAEYWLQLIRSFGGQSPVIVALNKSRQHPFDLNRGFLLEKYPQISEFVHTDCEDSFGIEGLRAAVLRETTDLEHRKVAFPADWFQIKERLAAMTDNFLTWDEYQEICGELGEMNAKAQRDLAGFLHILGIALNYRDDPRLKDTHVLNPRWVTEGIYSLLRSGHRDRQLRKGVLHADDLLEVLNAEDYPVTCHSFLLALMEKFQLCFPLPRDANRYLVPEMLGENQPEEIQSLLSDPGLGFRYQYEVLPEGLLPRFIVQTHRFSDSNPQWRWRTGVVLERDSCRAIVRADARERRVDIHVTGAERHRRDLLAIIRDRFDDQHGEFRGLVVDQRVPVPGERADVTVSYQFLLELEAEGEPFVRPEGAKQKYRVVDLLNGIEPPERRGVRASSVLRASSLLAMTTQSTNQHIFLSYCRDNEDDARQLHDDLIAAGESVWWDQDILPGQDWKFEIDQAMRAAYAVVVCFSQETQGRGTNGIYPELANAIEAYRLLAPGSIFIIPVRLSDCEVPRFEINATHRLDRLQSVDLFPPARRAANLQRLIQALQAAPNHP